jgi:hypothetical protein
MSLSLVCPFVCSPLTNFALSHAQNYTLHMYSMVTFATRREAEGALHATLLNGKTFKIKWHAPAAAGKPAGGGTGNNNNSTMSPRGVQAGPACGEGSTSSAGDGTAKVGEAIKEAQDGVEEPGNAAAGEGGAGAGSLDTEEAALAIAAAAAALQAVSAVEKGGGDGETAGTAEATP